MHTILIKSTYNHSKILGNSKDSEGFLGVPDRGAAMRRGPCSTALGTLFKSKWPHSTLRIELQLASVAWGVICSYHEKLCLTCGTAASTAGNRSEGDMSDQQKL